MTFKHAQLGDIEWVSHLVGEFYKGIGNEAYQIPFDESSMRLTVQQLIVHGICLLGPTSTAAAFFHPFAFNHSVRCAYVQFWCFKNAREMKILEALIDECEANGVRKVVMCSHAPHHRIGRFYRKLVAREVETNWYLDI